MATEVIITGFDKVQENIAKVYAQLAPEVIEGVLLDGANVLAQATINNAPQGPTGNLKRGIVAKTLIRRGNEPAPAIVAIDYRIAPHAHLIEFGHIIKNTRKGPASGFVPPHPFMRPAWDAYGEPVKEGIIEDLKAKIEGAPD